MLSRFPFSLFLAWISKTQQPFNCLFLSGRNFNALVCVCVSLHECMGVLDCTISHQQKKQHSFSLSFPPITFNNILFLKIFRYLAPLRHCV